MEIPALIAHRGLTDIKCPENSLSAIKNAVKNSIAVELDVRLTKDCKIVVFHDESLQRMTGAEAKIQDFTFEQLCALRLKNSDEKIPLLTEALRCINGKVPVFIDIKEGAPVGVMEKRLAKILKGYKGDHAVMSFNPVRVAWFAKFSPETQRGICISTFGKMSLSLIKKQLASLKAVYKAVAKPDFIMYDLRSVTMQVLMDAFDCGCALLGYTAKNEETLTEALKFCVGVVFENIPPQRAIEISKLEYSEESEEG